MDKSYNFTVFARTLMLTLMLLSTSISPVIALPFTPPSPVSAPAPVTAPPAYSSPSYAPPSDSTPMPAVSPAIMEGQEEPEEQFSNKAKLVIIDKRTAKRQELLAEAGETITHETIEIAFRRCWIEAKWVQPEHAALVDIFQPRNKPEERLIFSGWLFQQKSEISNLQHPQYDVQLTGCVLEKKLEADKLDKEEPDSSE